MFLRLFVKIIHLESIALAEILNFCAFRMKLHINHFLRILNENVMLGKKLIIEELK